MKKLLCGLIIAWTILGLGLFINVYNDFNGLPDQVFAGLNSQETQGEIDDSNEELDELKKEKEALEESLSEIEGDKEEALNYIKKLDLRSEDLSNKIENKNNKIEKNEDEIKGLKDSENVIKKNIKKLVEIMKKRIKYSYENGLDSYVETLIESKSLSQLYKELEYISQINKYDKSVYKDYKRSQNKLEGLRDKREEKIAELEFDKEILEEEKGQLDELISAKNENLSHYNALIRDSESSLSEYNAQIAEEEKRIQELMEEKMRQVEEENGIVNNGTPASGKISASGFRWPLACKARISCGFGPRKAPTAGASTYHKGIDISIPTGTPVLAAKAGKVVISTYSSSAGNFVCLYHGKREYTYYMHNSALKVKVGDHVEQGDVLSLSGSTGISTGPHLHFGMSIDGTYVDPLLYVEQ